MFPLFSWKGFYLPDCTATEGKLSFVRNRIEVCSNPGKAFKSKQTGYFLCVENHEATNH